MKQRCISSLKTSLFNLAAPFLSLSLPHPALCAMFVGGSILTAVCCAQASVGWEIASSLVRRNDSDLVFSLFSVEDLNDDSSNVIATEAFAGCEVLGAAVIQKCFHALF